MLRNGNEFFPVEGAHTPMSTFFCVSKSTALSALLVGASLMATLDLHAAKAEKSPKASSQDSAPVLMSKTGGGGGMWADLKELQQAAAKGNPKAQAQLGEMMLRGDGLPKDEKQGVALIEKAARAGNSAAAFRIGMLLANGDAGVAKDQGRALDSFRAAAAGGEAEAFFNIGAAYGSARGVKRDYGEALGWLIMAKERGAGADAESSLRTQLKSQPTLIEKGERRAKEIRAEFTGKKWVDLLPPPAALDTAVDPLKPALAPRSKS